MNRTTPRARRALGTLTAALSLTMAIPTAASAAPVADISTPGLEVLAINGVVDVDGDDATISFTYKCSSDTPATVWLSAKQLEDPTAIAEDWDFDTHGTSGLSHSWYDTHAQVPCDEPGRPARARKATIDVHRAVTPWGEWAPMEQGVAYVQLCLSTGDEEHGAFAAFYDWRQAR